MKAIHHRAHEHVAQVRVGALHKDDEVEVEEARRQLEEGLTNLIGRHGPRLERLRGPAREAKVVHVVDAVEGAEDRGFLVVLGLNVEVLVDPHPVQLQAVADLLDPIAEHLMDVLDDPKVGHSVFLPKRLAPPAECNKLP